MSKRGGDEHSKHADCFALWSKKVNMTIQARRLPRSIEQKRQRRLIQEHWLLRSIDAYLDWACCCRDWEGLRFNTKWKSEKKLGSDFVVSIAHKPAAAPRRLRERCLVVENLNDHLLFKQLTVCHSWYSLLPPGLQDCVDATYILQVNSRGKALQERLCPKQRFTGVLEGYVQCASHSK